MQATNVSTGNFVRLRHGGTHRTLYFHLRNGSVAVVPGQHVSAGTQLGLAASSGHSGWPHLHFQSENDGVVYVAAFGTLPRGTVVLDRAASSPRSTSPNSGFRRKHTSCPRRTRESPKIASRAPELVHFRFLMQNVPVQTSYEMRLRRPNGTIVATRTGTYNNATLLRSLFSWGSFDLEPAILGQWSVEIAFNGSTTVVAPFKVVGTSSEIVNRAPNAVSVSIKPARLTPGDVPRCEVDTSLLHEDREYDVMAYRYHWTVGDHIVREVTSAGLMDVLPRDGARAGDRIVCRVASFDGALEGPSASAEAIVSSPERPRAVRH